MRKIWIVMCAVIVVVSLVSAAGAATNIMPNPGAEEVGASPYSGYPQELLSLRGKAAEFIPIEGWGCYPSCGYCTWGATDKEVHSGKYSAFLTVDGSDDRGVTDLNICLGQTDGRNGKYAFTAKANTAYRFSFWLKGDPAPAVVYVRWLAWKTEEGLPEDREWRDTNLIGSKRIIPSAEWKKYEGTFTTAADTKKFVVRIQIPLQAKSQKGQTIYIEDVEITELTEGRVK